MSALRFILISTVLTLGYFAYGYLYDSNNYLRLIRKREAVTKASPQVLSLALAHEGQNRSGFLTGAELAKEDIENRSSLRVSLEDLELSPDAHRVRSTLPVFRSNFDISAIISDLQPDLASQFAVLCESYGVGLLQLNVESSFTSAEGFRYVNRVEPSFFSYCEAVIDTLGVITAQAENEPVRLGLLFDREALGGDARVNAVMEAARAHQITYRTSLNLQSAIKSGVVKGSDRLAALDSSLALQSGVPSDTAGLNSYLNRFQQTGEGGLDISIAEALERMPALKNPLELAYTQAFDSSGVDPSYVAATIKKGKADCVIVVGSLRRIKPILNTVNTLEVETPIIVLDYEPASWVESELGNLSGNLYLVSSVDTNSDSPAMQDFRERFRQVAVAKGRAVTEADEASILAYESVSMIGSVVEDHGTTVPIELMALLQMDGRVWTGLEGRQIGFNANGDGIGRSISVVRLRDGDFVSVKREEL